MIEEIGKCLRRVPFFPFLVQTSDGREYAIPMHDHAFSTLRGNRVIVVDDEGTTNVLGPLHINAVVDQKPNGEI